MVVTATLLIYHGELLHSVYLTRSTWHASCKNGPQLRPRVRPVSVGSVITQLPRPWNRWPNELEEYKGDMLFFSLSTRVLVPISCTYPPSSSAWSLQPRGFIHLPWQDVAPEAAAPPPPTSQLSKAQAHRTTLWRVCTGVDSLTSWSKVTGDPFLGYHPFSIQRAADFSLLNTRLIGPTSVLGIDKTSLEKKFVVEFIIIPLFLFQSLSFKGKIGCPFVICSLLHGWKEQNKILKKERCWKEKWLLKPLLCVTKKSCDFFLFP